MTVAVTGAAGFIGYHVAKAVLARGEAVIGLDNVNDYYDPALKRARLAGLAGTPGFRFHEIDIADHAALKATLGGAGIRAIVHLAAQPGVRYSLENPFAYVRSNLLGQVSLLEVARTLDGLAHIVYADSSSVYGAAAKVPFSVEDRADHPVSLYGATKRADELITYSYCSAHGLAATGLRIFTVYGPWGRPDMAPYLFTDAILAGRPIRVFNGGRMRRDFTYIDDIVSGILAAVEHPPARRGGVAHAIYNLGNNRMEELMRFIAVIEAATRRKAVLNMEGMQTGDVEQTYADIESARRDLGFDPKITIDVGIPRFVAWFKDYHRIA